MFSEVIRKPEKCQCYYWGVREMRLCDVLAERWECVGWEEGGEPPGLYKPLTCAKRCCVGSFSKTAQALPVLLDIDIYKVTISL